MPKSSPTKKKPAKSAKPAKKSASPKPKPAPKKPAGKTPAKVAAGKSPAKAPAKPPAKAAPAKVSSKPMKPVAQATAPVIAAPTAVAANDPNKMKPKGITIVNNKPMRKPKIKKIFEMPSLGAPLLGGAGAKRWKPLIPSGPNAKVNDSMFSPVKRELPKSTMPKKEMDRYREILQRKRSELVGDVSHMEGEALQGSSGSLSHTPQHMAEQGSEAYDQALSLDIAAVDRTLIKEIDDALKRIKEGTFGMCMMSHKPISKERLEELPWTRYSIEAARELERREFIRP